MKVLITGAAGFIGSSLVDELLNQNIEVVGIDNFNDYYNIERKEMNLAQAIKNPLLKLYKIDINDKQAMHNLFDEEKVDKVIHLAARAGVRQSLEDPFIYEKDNVHALLVLLELSRKYKVKQFIFGSSSSVYGNRDNTPFSEDDKADNPISPYAATKKTGELLCYTYHYIYNLNVSCLRFFTVYGPRGRPDMAIYKFIKKINEGKKIEVYGDGSSQRDYTFITDIVQGIVLSLNNAKSYAIYNLGNSKTVELNYLINLIENALGKKAKINFKPMQPGDVSITYCDITKSSKELGFKPKISIEEGIKKTVEWYLNEEALRS